MANTKKNQTKVGETQRDAQNSAGPPVGFTKRSAQSGDVPWVRKEAGAVVHGKVTGRFARIDDPNKHYYQVELYEECEVVKAGGETFIAERGTLVNLDENAQLAAVKEGIAEGQNVVWVRFVGKEKQRRDPSKTFWQIEVYTSNEELPI